MTLQAGSAVSSEAVQMTSSSNSIERSEHGKAIPRSSAPSSERFSVLLEKERGVPLESNSILRSLETFTNNWRSSERKLDQLVKTVPSSVRGVVELQVLVNRVHLQSELIARSADGVANSVKRMHQMGSG